MKVTTTGLQDCFVIEPQVFGDHRGYFFESYNQERFAKETGLDVTFVQDNQSKSNRGVLRGLHFQQGEFAQAKLVRVIQGKVLDVAVDIRPDSPTFGKTFSVILSGENQKQLFVPRGFAHGFSVLEDDTIFSYKCDNYYNKASESGIIYNDSELNIDWMLGEDEVLLSEKDKVLPAMSTFISKHE
jgi:dTDP-4-dehydrorhamnose 3,5-epimerase